MCTNILDNVITYSIANIEIERELHIQPLTHSVQCPDTLGMQQRDGPLNNHYIHPTKQEG